MVCRRVSSRKLERSWTIRRCITAGYFGNASRYSDKLSNQRFNWFIFRPIFVQVFFCPSHASLTLLWEPHHLPSIKELCRWGRDPQEGYRTLTDHNQVRDISRPVVGDPPSEVWRGLSLGGLTSAQVYIHPASALYQRNPEWIVYHELVPILAKLFQDECCHCDHLWPKWCSSCCCWGWTNPFVFLEFQIGATSSLLLGVAQRFSKTISLHDLVALRCWPVRSTCENAPLQLAQPRQCANTWVSWVCSVCSLVDVRMPSDLLVRKANPIRASTAGQIEPQWLPELAPNLFQRADPTKLSKRNLGSTELVMLLKEGAHFFGNVTPPNIFCWIFPVDAESMHSAERVVFQGRCASVLSLELNSWRCDFGGASVPVHIPPECRKAIRILLYWQLDTIRWFLLDNYNIIMIIYIYISIYYKLQYH